MFMKLDELMSDMLCFSLLKVATTKGILFPLCLDYVMHFIKYSSDAFCYHSYLKFFSFFPK